MSIDSKRCTYRYVSLTSNQSIDNQCILDKGHIGEHIKREIFPPPQQRPPQQGWIDYDTKDRNCIS